MKKLDINIDHAKEQIFVSLDFYDEGVTLDNFEDDGEIYLTFQEEEL